ncbi:SIMPL domain-containing protein [Chloroflexota bacterium]
MKRIWLVGISLAVVLAVAGLSGCAPVSPTVSEPADFKVSLSSQQEGIWISGKGEVSAVPDLATLRLGIEAQETTVAVAQSQAAEAMDKVMVALVDSGVAEKDIQTQYFNIRRVTRWDNVKEQEVVVGYRVTNMVTAKIREMDKIGSVVDVVAVAGGDLTRVDSISFSVEDPSIYHQEAREKAMVDVEAKAKQLAELAGVKLGRPTYITESAYMPSQVYAQGMVRAEAMPAPMPVETSISPGEMIISLTVQLAYAVE